MLKTRDQCKDAAAVYFRISGEVMPKFVIRNPYRVAYLRTLMYRHIFFPGASSFGCDARTSILLLLVC